jgi:hypothetical protein
LDEYCAAVFLVAAWHVKALLIDCTGVVGQVVGVVVLTGTTQRAVTVMDDAETFALLAFQSWTTIVREFVDTTWTVYPLCQGVARGAWGEVGVAAVCRGDAMAPGAAVGDETGRLAGDRVNGLTVAADGRAGIFECNCTSVPGRADCGSVRHSLSDQ